MMGILTRLKQTRAFLPLKAVYQRVRHSAGVRSLRRTRLARELAQAGALIRDPVYRAANRQAQTDFEVFCSQFGGAGLMARLLPPGTRKRALIVRNISIPYAKIEALVVKALQLAGFECIAVTQRTYDFLRYDWLVGNEVGYLFSDFDAIGDPRWVQEQMPKLVTTQDWLNLTYRGVRVGQFVLASTLRARREGQLDFRDQKVQSLLARVLNGSVNAVIGGSRLLDEIKPDCLLFMDRAYAGWGEIFDLALQRELDVITWNAGYKSNCLNFKRYTVRNERDHPLSPSAESWSRMRSFPWNRSYGDVVRQEILDSYKSEDWFSSVGTQFNKRVLSREATRRELGLSEDRKVAIIFPHILWDGSFFFGRDLFQDYTEWFVETIKAACANNRVQWVVKLHPAHVVKATQRGLPNRPTELAVLEGIVDKLPSHVTLLQPDSPISTYSLFQIADYAITVRGTIGIEAALLGVPVVTAGTGRYDGRGFTLDSSTRDEYRARLAVLETYPPLTRDQIELAERYAYFVFLCRPLRLSCASLEYARDGKATPIVTVHCQSSRQWSESPDMLSLADWFRDGTTEDFVGAKIGSVAPRDDEMAQACHQEATRKSQPDQKDSENQPESAI